MYLLRFFLFITILPVIFCSCRSQQIADNKLSGVWSGKAYQYDVDENWDAYFIMDIKNQRYIIDYPSLNCGGNWTLLESGKNYLEFRETLNRGESICTNNGRVVLEIKSKHQIDFYYYWPDDHTLNAKGSLYKQ